MNMGKGEVCIKTLNHSFIRAQPAVVDFNLNVSSGEFVSIVGPSGCGKTTVLNILAGLIPHSNGDVHVNGRIPFAGRADVAYMLARDCLLPWLTARDNAAFGNAIRNVPRQQREALADKFLDAVKLSDFKDRYPKELSHGMRQRVALARTFAMDSSLLLMDEPFGALDAQTKLRLQEVLLSLWGKDQKTVLFITHDLNEAIVLSDRVIVMSARPGRILADIRIDLPRPRSVTELQKNLHFHELYSELWSSLEVGLREAVA